MDGTVAAPAFARAAAGADADAAGLDEDRPRERRDRAVRTPLLDDADRAAWRRRNREELVFDYTAGRTVVRGRPAHLKLELTNFCNLACPMCPHSQMQRPVGYMTESLFRRVIDMAGPELEFVYLHHLGESLFHPRIGDFIAYARRQGVATGLSTNATYLDPRKASALLEGGLDFLVVSLDAGSRESYASMRPGGDFERTVDNIRALCAEKAARRSRLHVVVQLILSEHNQHEVAAFAQRWQGVGQVMIKLARDWAGQVPLDRLLRREKSAASDLRPPPSGGAMTAAEPGATAGFLGPCRMLWTELTVFWDGRVVPCANFYEAENLVGDLGSQELDEVWNGAPMQALRRAHLERRVAEVPVCRGCPRHALDAADFIAVDQLGQRLRQYAGLDLTPRPGLS